MSLVLYGKRTSANKVTLPPTSQMWDFVDQSDAESPVLRVTESQFRKKRKIRCPICDKANNGVTAFRNHGETTHLQPWRWRNFKYEETHYIPRQLANTAIRVERSTNLAICMEMACLLLRHEVFDHVRFCKGCLDVDWDVYDEAFDSISDNKQLQIRESRNRVMTGMMIQSNSCNSCQKVRQKYNLEVNNVCCKFTDFGNNTWIHTPRRMDELRPFMLRDVLLEYVHSPKEVLNTLDQKSAKFASFLKSYASALDVVVECFILFDDCTTELHHNLAQRWQNTDLTCPKLDRFYAKIANLDRPLLDLSTALQVEYVLRSHAKKKHGHQLPSFCLPKKQRNSAELQKHFMACRDLSERIFRLLCVVLVDAMAPQDVSKLVLSNYVTKTLSVQFEERTHVTVIDKDGTEWHLPWVVSELVVRYCAIIRPLQAELRLQVNERGKYHLGKQHYEQLFDRINVPQLMERFENDVMGVETREDNVAVYDEGAVYDRFDDGNDGALIEHRTSNPGGTTTGNTSTASEEHKKGRVEIAFAATKPLPLTSLDENLYYSAFKGRSILPFEPSVSG